MSAMLIDDDRLFPAESCGRRVARALYAEVRHLPIVSPHGHTQAAWFASNGPFPDPATLFVQASACSTARAFPWTIWESVSRW
jgi:glucuronate isomerase